MDLQQLKTFLEVCQTRHFGHAASNLYLTQSAVSFRIRQLEGQLGTALFIRHRNNLQLTEAGERLRRHAEHILASWEQARRDVLSQQQRAAILSLASTPAIGTAWLSPALLELQQRLAGHHWRFEALTPEQISRRLLEHSLDLAVLPVPPKVDELTSQALAPLPLVLTTPAGVELNAALEQAFVQLDWAPRLPFSPNLDTPPVPALHTGDLTLANAWVRRYQGAAMLPRAQAELDDWQAWPEQGQGELPLYLVHHASHPDLPALTPIIDYLLQR